MKVWTADFKTRSRLENEKPGNEKLNARFTLKCPFSTSTEDCLTRVNILKALDKTQCYLHPLGPFEGTAFTKTLKRAEKSQMY